MPASVLFHIQGSICPSGDHSNTQQNKVHSLFQKTDLIQKELIPFR